MAMSPALVPEKSLTRPPPTPLSQALITIHTTGWSQTNAENGGDVGQRTALGSQSGAVSQSLAMQAIDAQGHHAASDADWTALTNEMADDASNGYLEDFSIARLIDSLSSTESSTAQVRTNYDLTRILTPTTIEVPVSNSDNSDDSNDQSASSTVEDEGDGGTRTVDVYEITTLGSMTVTSSFSYSITQTAGQTELLYASQQSGGSYVYVPGEGSTPGAGYSVVGPQRLGKIVTLHASIMTDPVGVQASACQTQPKG